MSDPDQSGTSRGEAGSEQGTPAQDEAQSTAATSGSGGATEQARAGQGEPAESGAAESGATKSTSTETEAAESKSASAGTTEAGSTEAGSSQTGSDSSTSTQKLDTAAASSGESAGKSDEAGTAEVSQGSGESATSEQQAVDGESEDAGSGEQPEKKSKAGVLLGLVSGAFVLLLALVLVAFFVWPGYAGPGSPDKEVDKTTAALASKDAGQLEQVSCHGPDGKPTAQIPPQAMQLIQEAKPAGAPQLVVDTEAHAPVDLTLSAQGQTQTLPSVAVMGVSDHQWCLKGLAQRQ